MLPPTSRLTEALVVTLTREDRFGMAVEVLSASTRTTVSKYIYGKRFVYISIVAYK